MRIRLPHIHRWNAGTTEQYRWRQSELQLERTDRCRCGEQRITYPRRGWM